jgi:peptidoglycan/xylan/chitin deacetylase (PgdA/CDA1 family)
MKKWLMLGAVFFLLLSGCRASKSETLHARLEGKDKQGFAELQANPLTNSDTPGSLHAPSTAGPSIAAVSSAPSQAPRPVLVPVPKPSQRPSSPRGSAAPKSKAHKADSAKKPSVPANKAHGQSRAGRKSLTLAELAHKYPDVLRMRGSAKEKKAALTFDDGPDSRFTPKVLDVLKAAHVKATFFLIGTKANAQPELVRRIVREGHVVGNHSYSHANFPKLTPEQFHQQIEGAEHILQTLTGYAPKLIRPPYGAVNEQQLQWLADHHYLIVNWNVDSLDWKELSSDQVLSAIMQQTRPGSIILQHSGGGDNQDLSGTVLALPELIRRLQADGYQLVTIPELLHVPRNQ